MIVPARAYEKGFTVAVYDTRGRVAVKSTQIAYTIERSRISTMEAFEFVLSGPLSLHLENTSPLSISYKKKVDPASNVNWVLVQKSYLDFCVANISDISADEWLASFLENKDAATEIVGNDSTCLVTATQGFHFKSFRELMPATDYILVAAYYNGILHGEIVKQSVRTADAEGTAPELTISPLRSNARGPRCGSPSKRQMPSLPVTRPRCPHPNRKNVSPSTAATMTYMKIPSRLFCPKWNSFKPAVQQVIRSDNRSYSPKPTISYWPRRSAKEVKRRL